MDGPEKLGYWNNIIAPNLYKDYDNLDTYQQYKVIREFVDYDGDLHKQDEEWIFLGYSFVPYHNTTSWFVSLDGKHEWQIRIQNEENANDFTVHLKDYLQMTTVTLRSEEINFAQKEYEALLLQHNINVEKNNIKQSVFPLFMSLIFISGGIWPVLSKDSDGVFVGGLFTTTFGCFAFFFTIRGFIRHVSILHSYKQHY